MGLLQPPSTKSKMGNIFRRSKKKNNDTADYAESQFQDVIHTQFDGATDTKSPVEQWEEKQKELNFTVMEKMREDFHNRPDNFLLNLLVVSLQYYRNFGREKNDISNHIRDREQALSKKLTPSKRKIIYMGGFEEISGTHVLYQAREEKYMELPIPLQIFVVQDNLEVYTDGQYEELQQRNYSDPDGPSYRFCTEYSKKHLGYVRLRCADIIPGLSRHNTYEDIYAYMAPVDVSLPDPIVELRPIRRKSLVSTRDDEDTRSNIPPAHIYTKKPASSFDEEEEDEFYEMKPPLPSQMGRRLSGIIPLGYPSNNSLSNTRKKPNDQQNGFPGRKIQKNDPKKDVPNLTERRPSGIFPKMNPNMNRLTFSKSEQKKISTDNEFADLKKILAHIDEESEDEEKEEDEADGSDNDGKNKFSIPITNGLMAQVPTPPVDSDGDDRSIKSVPTPCLHASLNTGCFVNRKIKVKVEGDAYGVQARSELRTYISSMRYLDCFEEDFEEFLEIIGKEHLMDSSNMQQPAILASELMIKGIGPKFNTEFIPTILLKEWPNCAFEWRLRERKPRTDPQTKMIYRWPKPNYIHEVTKMGCNLVPIGHYNPTQPNTAMKIEWQIQFARAEQLLLRSLGHTQIRVLLLVEFLMRDHLKDIPGLKTIHLRYILFWMCEHNFRDWQEERLGIKLKAYFKTLYNCLSTENLPHYFIDKCNMMNTIPERYLRQIQALVRNMKDNLPTYLMHTMYNMRTEGDFYPTLDIKALYKIVTAEHYGMEDINPALLNLGGGEPEQNKFDDGEDVLYSDSDELEHRELKDKLHELRKKKTVDKNPTTTNTPLKKRKASAINLRRKIQNVKDLRAGKVLTMFAKHFIQMARSSNKYRSYPQAYMYLLMAGNMATLLDETGNGVDAQEFKKEIEELNFASRGGVRDMLGTSWAITDNYDIIPGHPNLRGSNWELKKEQMPLPQLPRDFSPITGVKFSKNVREEATSSLISGQTISPTLSRESLLDDITDLPDSPMERPTHILIISDDEDLGSTNM